MRLQFATEALVQNEVAPHLATTRETYGRCIEIVAFGRRWIIDLIR